ncbi:FMN-binding negative transcriptional regulator [Granulicella sp. S190]|uniref:FMN-binding negative transcriptional regulator n=1 Tax=Granulicella sp. S190 TaxID=1747226 RepID=UPI00131B7745|nr:FMN-binding negative transcriptional regulator [Granulicella sp. S190]
MYIPRANQETRIPVIHQLMDEQPFASLITMGASGLFATHIPMVLERQGDTLGRLRCHISRANPQWREFSPGIEALAIFSGPQHYITPNWYPEKQENGKVVPTWNYAVVHAHGHLNVIQDLNWLRSHLESLTTVHEAGSPVPWKIEDAPADYIASQIKGIVGLEMVITRLEGKWKASQNRSEPDREGVANGLAELNTSESLAMKSLVERRD